MRRLITSAAVVMLGMALPASLSYAQVRSAQVPDSQHPAKSATVSVIPSGHGRVMPTPIGVSPAPAPAFPAPTPIGVPPTLPVPSANNFGNGLHHRHSDGFPGGAYPVYVPVPVVVDPYSMYQDAPEQMNQDGDDQTVVPGPTVFERRAPGDMAAESSDPGPAATEPVTSSTGDSSAQQSFVNQPAQPQEPSVLVFRDGHKLEVQNYAIVGDMLYDFTVGHARKVPLSQLDLPATVKANDDRGVDFTLPAAVKGGS